MGRRYGACLNDLKQDFKIIDIETDPKERESILDHCNKAIICSSTRSHLELVNEMQQRGITYLCEKPFVKYYPTEFDPGRGYIVNNWSFVIDPWANGIFYNFYNTGKDGLLWDVCQLITLSCNLKASLEIQCSSPIWDVRFSERQAPYGRQIHYREIEMSYVQMLKAFIEDDVENLWTMETALDQIKQVQHISLEVGVAHEQSVIRGSGSIKIDPATWEDFRKYRREIRSSVGS